MPFARTLGIALIVAALSPCAGAQGQSYPVRPLRIIVPFPPSGPNDIFARLTAQKLQEVLGQQTIVDNRGGGGGTIGAELAARANPDGYTLFFGGAAVLSINPSMGRKLAYDPLKDFSPISLIATAPSVLVVHPGFVARSVKDLIAIAKAKPGQINYASAGVGTNPHLAGELFKVMAGVDLVHVPYKGGGPATVDLLAGQVPIYFSGISLALPHVQDGKLRALAVTSLKRTVLMPQMPTVAESGLPGYEVSNWYALLGPARISPPRVAMLNAALLKGIAMPDARKLMLDLGADPVGSTPEELTRYIGVEIEKWTKVIRAANIRAE